LILKNTRPEINMDKTKINIKQLAWFDGLFLMGILWVILNISLSKRIAEQGISQEIISMNEMLFHWKWAIFGGTSFVIFGLSKLIERLTKDEYLLDIIRVGVVELPVVVGFCLALYLKSMDCFYWLGAVTLLGLAINFPKGMGVK
jgi:hypothetical protein